jgi:hypothetical protein
VFPAVAAVLSTAAGALHVAPMLGGVVGLAIIAAHTPEVENPGYTLTGSPELAAECMKRNIAAQNTRLVAIVQPLHGNHTYGVVLKMGPVGEPLLTAVIQEGAQGSTAEFRRMGAASEPADVVPAMIKGC